MLSPSVLETFDRLVETLDREICALRAAAAAAIRDGRDEEADHLRRFIRDTTRLRETVHRSRQNWLELLDEKEHRGARRRLFSRAPRGQRLPEKAYYVPILRALAQLGGEAPVRHVLDLVYEQIKGKLTQIDLSPMPSDARTLRWRNAAAWARQKLVSRGLLKKGTPHGIWAISERGRDFLAQQAPA